MKLTMATSYSITPLQGAFTYGSNCQKDLLALVNQKLRIEVNPWFYEDNNSWNWWIGLKINFINITLEYYMFDTEYTGEQINIWLGLSKLLSCAVYLDLINIFCNINLNPVVSFCKYIFVAQHFCSCCITDLGATQM